MTIYGTQIRPLLDFFVSKYLFYKVQIAQNQALRICRGAMRSAPICVLQASCNEMPLNKRHEYICLNYKAKLKRLPVGSHPPRNLIKDSGLEVHCFTDQGIATFNPVTESPIFDRLVIKPRTLHEEPLPGSSLAGLRSRQVFSTTPNPTPRSQFQK